MKRLFSLLIAVSLHLSPASAWEFLNIEGSGAGTLNACAATHRFSDSWLTIRLYGDEMDILVFHQDFAFPYDQVLGAVAIGIDGTIFESLAASFAKDANETSNTTGTMQLFLKNQDYGPIFDKIRTGSSLGVGFPNGDTYSAKLYRSARALNMASDCWRAKQTGPDEKNPFLVPQQENPFQAPASAPANPFEQPA